jgi:hypothetical protein
MRQIHLDCHTSEKIAGIGADFDADRFADTLQRAHVNSVTLFSRCHHGWIYHDTKFEDLKHPHLECDLLPLQMEACRARGIQTPVYVTVGWDERAAREHPEWREHHPGAGLAGAGPLEASWKTLCFNTPYIDFVAEQTREVLEKYSPEGIFFDIIFQGPCCCPWCLAGMEAEGIDAADPAGRGGYAAGVLRAAKEKLYGVVREAGPEVRCFFNSGHVDPGIRDSLDHYSHLELESLPSGGWGYMHFPVTVRYARKLGLEYLAMTGKFHAMWGHFSSFKNPAALEYETLVGPAHGAAISIGDQLHPRGILCDETYDRIGHAYGMVEEREPWYLDAEPVTEIAVFNTDACEPTPGVRLVQPMTGVTRILMEGHHQFDIVDGEMDWDGYSVLVLPDKVSLDPTLAAKVQAFLAQGGKVLATHRSGESAGGEARFVLPEWPVDVIGEQPMEPDFIQALEPLVEGLPSVPFVAYEPGLESAPRPDAEVLADTYLPYFERSFRHFCSHAHAPIEGKADYPSAVRKGDVIYLSHPHCTAYNNHGQTEDAQIVRNALSLLLPTPLVQADAPSTCHITITRQPAQRRWIVHLLHYIPERRADGRDLIQDVIPLYDINLRLRVPGSVSGCYLAPSRAPLPSEQREPGVLELTVPEIRGYAMVVLEGLE